MKHYLSTDKLKCRYNFNVIRPLRFTKDFKGAFSDDVNKVTIADATLSQTIQGFCDIKESRY